jgi:formylglycine-generating enzyme required for sulfatase activity
LLAIIGDDWLDVCDADGRRRLENANDFVRIEIEAALKRKIPVIPVLVENARLPAPRELPEGLHELAYKQALEVRSGAHVEDHFRRLNAGIRLAFDYHRQRSQRPLTSEQPSTVVPPARSNAAQPDGRNPAPLEVITNSIGMRMTVIPAGRFQMGSPNDESGRRDNEGPAHDVEITHGFHLGVTPVTQEEYLEVVGDNPSYFRRDGRRPVEKVSWFDAVKFCNRLSEREQLSPYYQIKGQQVAIVGGVGYRLPTEAEWEYACRAGKPTPWCFGADKERLGEYAWYGDNSNSQTHPVATKRPNDWGLYDMHGNVWEWCQDWYGTYSVDPQIDPTGPPSGSGRVLRGGSWVNNLLFCRSAIRNDFRPDDRFNNYGFRAART